MVLSAIGVALGDSFARAPWGWGVLALMVLGFFQLRPVMARIAMNREAALGVRVAALEAKVDLANQAAHAAQMQVTYVTAALGMVSAELERRDPGNPVIKQARDLVAQATYADTFGTQLAKLATARGTGE